MADGDILHLLAPGLLGPVPPQLQAAISKRHMFPTTEWLLARSRRCATTPDELSPWPKDFAGAGALGVLGVGGDPRGNYWYRADPIHLRPDRDRLMLFAGEPADIDMSEAQCIAAAFNDLFAEDGLELVPLTETLFLRALQPQTELDLRPTREVSGRYVDAFLPEGAPGREWRQLLNETQMLLHGLDINLEREARGRLPVNGLWFWGGGRLPSPRKHGRIERIYTNDPGLAGVARHTGTEVGPAVERLSQLGAPKVTTVAHWANADQALIGGDVEGWLSALQHFEQAWAREAVSALAGGAWSEIRLYAGGDRGFRLTPGMHRRFWRRQRSLSAWLERA